MSKDTNKFIQNLDRRIAIVGMGCHYPGATNLEEYWKNIVQAKDCITDIPEDTHWKIKDYFDEDQKIPDKTYCKRGGFLPFVDFDPMKYGIGPKDVDVIDTAQLLGMKVAREAMADAGYLNNPDLDLDKVCCIVGTTCITELATPLNMRLSYPVIDQILDQHGVDEQTRDSITEQYRESYPIWQENSFPGVLGNVVSGRIASHLNLGGTNCVIDAACASSLGAIKMSIDSLLTGTSDMAITGGVDTENNIFMYMCFSKTPAFSAEGKSRPFSADSDGILIAEGIGLVVLKRYEDAVRDNDKIYAVIDAMGSSSDGKGKSIYQPVPQGQAKAVKQAYEMAGVTPEHIQLLEAHGTGTRVGDFKEFQGLQSIYQSDSDKNWCAMGSVKSQIGHCKASAGVAGLMKAALSLHHKVLPPTINISEPNPKMGIEDTSFYLNTEARPWVKNRDKRYAASSAFGFGGTNFHAVLSEFDTESYQSIYRSQQEVFVFGEESIDQLKETVKAYQDYSKKAENINQLARFNQHSLNSKAKVKAAVIAKDFTSLLDHLNELETHLTSQATQNLVRPNKIYFMPQNSHEASKVAFLFAGQGAQHPAMVKDFVFTFPECQKTLDKVEAFRSSQKWDSISKFAYPIPVFSNDERQKQRDSLTQTNRAQPALAFANLAVLDALTALGLKADVFGGHSFGELSALYAAGVVDFESYMKLSEERGKLMQECAENSDGTMAAVLAPLDKIQSTLSTANSKLNTSVVLANINSPSQGVISGKTTEIDSVCEFFTKEKLTVKRIPVGAAFHTELMKPAVDKFKKMIDQTKFNLSKLSVYSNTSAKVYPNTEAEIKSCLANQLLNPVSYVEEISQMHKDGANIFVEVGPGKIQSGLIKSILDKNETLVFSTDSGDPKNNPEHNGLKNFSHLVAQLFTLGKIDFNAAFFGEKQDTAILKDKLSPVTIKLNGANYRTQKTKDARDQKPKHPLPKPKEIIKEVIKHVNVGTSTGNDLQKPVQKVQSPSLNTNSNVNQQAVKSTAAASQTPTTATQPMRRQAPKPLTGTPMQNSGNIPSTQLDEFNRYRLKMVEVHQQFLFMQTEANRVFEQMVTGQTLALPQAAPQFAPQTVTQTVAQPVAIQAPVAAPVQAPVAQPVAVAPTPVAAPAPVAAPTPVAAKAAPKSGSLLSSMFEKPAHEPKAAPVVASTGASKNKIEGFLLEVIADKTGFPVDMLTNDMNLEDDLAVDSIRRVEILGSVQEEFPNAPVVGPSQMGILNTIGDIINYLAEGSEDSAPAATSSAPASTGSNEIASFLMDVIADKTGFPVDMLTDDMNLEDDLAVDSIRRVEILGAVQEKFPNAPVVGPSQMGILNTIGDIVGYLSEGAQSAPATSAPAATSGASSIASEIGSFLLNVIADKTGFPEDMLNDDMNLEDDLAVDSIRRVEILGAVQEKFPEAPVVGPSQMGILNTIGDIVSYLCDDKKKTALA
ncbi:MAG: acyltransferase domain-containing protein [Candidatus Cloacimonetes bacterium]|nr:acyltransferase domain-containing protein [Candidatus Cloacimonadota bacterium]